MSAPFSLRPLCIAMTSVFVAGLAGCSEPDPVITYTIPTKVPPQLVAGKDRMLAVMLPRESEVWFFKVTGPEQAIAQVEDQLRDFVTAVTFDGDSPNLKNLPKDWRRAGEWPMRFASINIDTADKQLDLSVSKLSRQLDWDEQVRMNVNRWRNQVGLEPSEEKWGGAEAIEITPADATGIWVDLIGQSGGGSMSPPFAGGGRSAGGPFSGAGEALPPDHPPVSAPSQNDSAAASSPLEPDSPLKYEAPEGWRPGKMSSMRMAAFNVGPDDAPAEITIISAGGDLKGNVRRWMGQVREAEVTDQQVEQAMSAVEEVEVAGLPGQRYVLVGDEETIDATIVPLQGGSSLFIKMKGPAKTVADQSGKTKTFLESITLKP